MPGHLDRCLLWLKYGVLAALLGAALVSQPLADRIVEIEPFKTAITLGFERAWPYVSYAIGLLLSAVLFKAFCRYLCPLGAALALIGRVRRHAWIPRRSACAAPCRACGSACAYRAIARDGRVDYGECFQCLDCVALYQDSNRCLPLVRVQRRPLGPQAPGHGNTGRRIPIRGSADDQAAQPVAIEVDLG